MHVAKHTDAINPGFACDSYVIPLTVPGTYHASLVFTELDLRSWRQTNVRRPTDRCT